MNEQKENSATFEKVYVSDVFTSHYQGKKITIPHNQKAINPHLTRDSWLFIPFLNQDGNAQASEQRRDSTMSTARRRTTQPTK